MNQTEITIFLNMDALAAFKGDEESLVTKFNVNHYEFGL